jgi:hypothetical protein
VNKRLLGLAAGGVAAIAAVVVVVVLVAAGGGSGGGGGSDDSVRAALTSAGCDLKIVVAAAGADHSITTPEGTSDKWNTDPPTNGPHYAETALFGAYSEPLQFARVIHNLEHGAIYVVYGDKVADETVEQLTGFYNEHQNGTLLAPLPRLGDKIAMGAWNAPNPSDPGKGILATCTAFDEAAYTAFFDAYQFKGPERFPPGSMAPGGN